MENGQILAFKELTKSIKVRESYSAAKNAAEARSMIDAKDLVTSWARMMYMAENVAPEDIPRMRLQFDMLNMMMKKVLPDLKAVEVANADESGATVINLDPDQYRSIREKMLKEDDC